MLYDLDVEARDVAAEIGLNLVRCPTVGTHPAFVATIRELIVERLSRDTGRPTLGSLGPSPDVCAADCCLPGTGRPSPWQAHEASPSTT